MAQTVVGIFKDADKARRAVDQLINSGFSESSVDVSTNRKSISMADHGHDTDYYPRDEKDINRYDDTDRARITERDRDTDEHESGIVRFFKNLFGNDDESDRYAKVAKNNSVVTVYAQDETEAKRAAEMLDDYGAIDVDEEYKNYSDSDYTNTAYTGTAAGGWGTDTQRGTANVEAGMNPGVGMEDADSNVSVPRSSRDDMDRPNINEEYRGTDRGNLANNEGRTIPIIEENLQVGKREIERGGVRIRSRIVETPVEETIRLREERVRVERNPADRDAHPSDIDSFEEGTVELRERAEVPVVSKEARVVEEISLDRDVDHREETIRDTVRHTEVDVEEIKDRDRRESDNV